MDTFNQGKIPFVIMVISSFPYLIMVISYNSEAMVDFCVAYIRYMVCDTLTLWVRVIFGSGVQCSAESQNQNYAPVLLDIYSRKVFLKAQMIIR